MRARLGHVTVTLWTNATVATMRGGSDEYGLIEGGAVAWDGETILAVGSCNEVRTMIDADAELEEVDLDEIDLEGRLVTPGLVDCHTHLVFAGSRAAEFEQRIAGATYAEIAAAGGGIRTTMTATRAATEDELVAAALPRLDALIGDGVTTVEIKSGYGLDLDTELRLLRAAHRLATERHVEVVPTLLAAHTVPPEFAGRADDYIAFVCDTIIPAVAASGLAGAVDVFCESIAFDLDQSRRVAQAAAAHGLSIKGHTEQLSALGGGPMLAAAGALSIDHGEHLGDQDVDVIAEHGTVVVLLPGACYFTGERQHPPVEAMRAAGVPMAVATDTNPGTSPLASLRLAANQACVTFGLTVPEAMHGITSVAARALGLHDRGRIASGARADLVAWDVDHPAELVYEPVTPRQYRRIVAGSA
ncbi:MAG: imidazolonepropionase [Acidimicrobiia bacterium]|nr:imidazolonepropionase [Acidimicrobiia bacterium]